METELVHLSMEVVEKYVTAITASSRLNREDCRDTEHDSAFTKWKVLIGSSDWEDHSNGKEGAERYRTQNLPNCASCPGVYEFGIPVRSNKTGRESGKLDPGFIIPVYLGKSENIRIRLQQYGSNGAHLENGSSKAKLNDCRKILAQARSGLFSDVFSKGFSIVYRWAPMKSTRDAEKTESGLLDKYDYAWNRASNGPRRRNDILKKLSSQKNKGIKIKAYELPYLENGLNFYTNLETNGLLHQIFKFGRSQPRLVVRSGINENYAGICGVALGHGVICKSSPIEGNKRCSEHKRMQVNGFISKLLTDGKSNLVANDYPVNENSTQVSGVILDDGSCCTSKPVPGNRRCLEQKGRKICNSTPQIVKDKKNTSISRREETPSFFEHSGSKSGGEKSQNHYLIPSVFHDKISPTCGAATQDGSSCRRKPAEGDKRCWQRKSVGVNSSPGSSSYDNLRRTNTTSEYASYSSVYEYFPSSTCGAATQDGSSCSRKPTQGNKRCWQHKGMWANSSPGSSNNSRYYANSYRYASSSTCGAPTRNGSYCRRSTSGGRCRQHGG